MKKDCDGLIRVCKEEKFCHDSLLHLLPRDEHIKHETWFKAKMSKVRGGPVKDDGHPDDGISNVGSNHSSPRSHCSGTSSSTSSARIIAEAE